MHCGLPEYLPDEYKDNPARKQGKSPWRIPKMASTPKKALTTDGGNYSLFQDDDDSFYEMVKEGKMFSC